MILVDTGAFLALLSKRDNHHQKAKEIYSDLLEFNEKLLTTNHIIDETCTWLLRSKKTGHKIASEFGEAMLNNSKVSFWNLSDDPPNAKFLVITTPPEIERSALSLFSQYDTSGFSFTDCISFAVMQRLRIEKAFSFDSHFDILGFERL